MTPDAPLLAADAVLVLHFAFATFVVGGWIVTLHGWRRGWQWTRAFGWRVTHLGATGIVALLSIFNVACPLTTLESSLRMQGGDGTYAADGCIAYWVQRALFYDIAPWIFTAMYAVFALGVLATFVLYPPRQKPGCKGGLNDAK
jgi:hypothetical protein